MVDNKISIKVPRSYSLDINVILELQKMAIERKQTVSSFVQEAVQEKLDSLKKSRK